MPPTIREALRTATQHAREGEGVPGVTPERLAWHRAHVVELERARARADEALEEARRQVAEVRRAPRLRSGPFGPRDRTARCASLTTTSIC